MTCVRVSGASRYELCRTALARLLLFPNIEFVSNQDDFEPLDDLFDQVTDPDALGDYEIVILAEVDRLLGASAGPTFLRRHLRRLCREFDEEVAESEAKIRRIRSELERSGPVGERGPYNS